MHHSDSATVTTIDTLAKILDVCGELRASEQVDERAVTAARLIRVRSRQVTCSFARALPLSPRF